MIPSPGKPKKLSRLDLLSRQERGFLSKKIFKSQRNILSLLLFFLLSLWPKIKQTGEESEVGLERVPGVARLNSARLVGPG